MWKKCGFDEKKKENTSSYMRKTINIYIWVTIHIFTFAHEKIIIPARLRFIVALAILTETDYSVATELDGDVCD